MKTKSIIFLLATALFSLASCEKHEIVKEVDEEGEYRLEIDGLEETKGTAATVELNLANLSYVSSKNVSAQLKRKSGTSWVSVNDGVTYTWTASAADSKKFSGSGTVNKTCTIAAIAEGSGTMNVSATLNGSNVASTGVPVTVSDSRALTWSNATTTITSGTTYSATLTSNFSCTATISSDNSSFVVGTSSSSLSSTVTADFTTNTTKTIYYKYTGSEETTIKITATVSSYGISKSFTVSVKKSGSAGKLGLWDDDGIFRFTCYDNDDYELTANMVKKNGLYGNFCGCAELKNMTLFNYYIYDYEEGSIYTKYKDDTGIQVTLYACSEDAIYDGGIVLSECKSNTVYGQSMGEQEDCSDITLSGCEFSMGELYVGIKIRFSDGTEYWVKLDDTSYDGGKPLIQSDCYMVGMYNSSEIYTKASSRKTVYYYTDRYDVVFYFNLENGEVKYDGQNVAAPVDMTFKDNYGHTYVIPKGTVTLVLDKYSQGDDIFDDGNYYSISEQTTEFQMSPTSDYWWYATTPSFDTGYINKYETDSYIVYTKYVFDVDK